MAAITVTHPGLQVPTLRWKTDAVYRRRRLVVAAVALGILLSLGWVLGALGGGPLTASEDGAPSGRTATVALHVQPVAAATYVVGPGDTLWSIARHLVPEGDVRPVVDALAADRDGRPLQVGERITVDLP